jgi:serpin B
LAALAAGCTPAGPASPGSPPTGPAAEPTAPPPSWSADLQAAADGVNRFTFDLYAKLRGEPGSVFASPFSVATAFAMLADGANGPTRDELLKTLHLPAAVAAAGDLGRYYAAGGKPYELSVANALWGQTGYPWRPEFLTRQRERFGAKLTDHDFKADPEAGRAAVNGWVEQRTKDRIKNLLPPGSVTERARLFLANAVYFKGRWADEFKPAATSDQPFTKADGSKSPVPLMHRSGTYKHARLDGFQVLELPYQGGELAMDVILPADHTGLPAVEAKLTGDTAREWLGKLASTPDVRVYLPRFKVEDECDLPATMKAMGVRLAFDPDRADLLGLVTHLPPDDLNLFVAAARHKAFVEVTEEGTEAAAATGVVGWAAVSRRIEPPPTVFRADRPFLFLIRDVKHDTVLFAGRYAGPEGTR